MLLLPLLLLPSATEVDAITSRLDNGLTVVVRRVPGVEVFSAQLFVRAGSFYETTQTNGITHLLEHMLFRGSEAAADGAADDLAERHGCYLNGTTYREAMRLVCDGPAGKWREGLKALSLLAQRPKLDPLALAVEKSVLHHEIAALESDRRGRIERALWVAAFGELPASLPSMGLPSAIADISKAQLDALYSTAFAGANSVVVLCGDFDVADAFAEMEKRFSFMPNGGRRILPALPKPAPSRLPSGFAWLAPGLDRPESYTAWEALAQVIELRSLAAGLTVSRSFGPSEAGTLLTVVYESGFITGNQVLAEIAGGVGQSDLESAKRRLRTIYGARAANPQEAALVLAMETLLIGRPMLDGAMGRIERLDLAALNEAARAIGDGG